MSGSNIWEILKSKYPERQPYDSEKEFFQKNKNTAGMMTEDQAVIINPFTGLKPEEIEAVKNNERVRLFLKNLNMTPSFGVTPEQQSSVKGTAYENSPEIKNTLIARYLTGDPSAGNVTPNQKEFALNLVQMIQGEPQFKMNNPQESDFQGWYENIARAIGMQGGSPDDPRHHYDYRMAKTWGAQPQRSLDDGEYHWTSDFKTEGHPRTWIKGRNTKTGEKL